MASMILEAEVGMLIVETIAKIRRAFFVQGKPIKAICRELSVSRKVVRLTIHQFLQTDQSLGKPQRFCRQV